MLLNAVLASVRQVLAERAKFLAMPKQHCLAFGRIGSHAALLQMEPESW